MYKTITKKPSDLKTATATAAVATVTVPAPPTGQSHYVTHLSASYGAAQIGLLTLKDGATIIGNYHVHNQREVVFDSPIQVNGAVEASLAAGAVGVVGAVNLGLYTL